MRLVDDIALSAWYRLRRSSRRRRNTRARAAFERALSSLGSGDVCVDCGANTGTITARLADTGATVHAFEPDPVAFEVLSQAVGSRRNVILHQAAVGIGSGTVALYRTQSFQNNSVKGTQGSSTIATKTRASTTNQITVTKVDFPDFIRSLGIRVALVKMDIEGAELAILRQIVEHGMHECIGQMFVETHEKQLPEMRRETRDVIRLTRRAGNINCDWW
jgi:FkbM family methyltransferase